MFSIFQNFIKKVLHNVFDTEKGRKFIFFLDLEGPH